MQVNVSFNLQWIYSDGGIHASSVNRLVQRVNREFSNAPEVSSRDMTDVSFEFPDDFSVDTAREKFVSILREITNAEVGEKCTLRLNGNAVGTGSGSSAGAAAGEETEGAKKTYADFSAFLKKIGSERAAAGGEVSSETTDAAAESADSPSGDERLREVEREVAAAHEALDRPYEPTALQRIENLVGAVSFKELAREINARSAVILQNGTQKLFFSEAYLFSVDSGGGLHTSLELLGDLLSEKKLFTENNGIAEFNMPRPKDSELEQKMNNLIGSIGNALERQRIISIHIAPWLGMTESPEFKRLLLYIFQHNENCLIVFDVPAIKKSTLDESASDISDIINTRSVAFEAFDRDELRQLATQYLQPYGIRFDDEAMEAFDQRISREKHNGYFYGVHTVQKVAAEMVRALETQTAYSKTITGEIAKSTVQELPDEDENLSFDRLVGMDEVSARLYEVINQIRFARSHNTGSKPAMHMCFVGNPGTGKTTVARILGQELKRLDILRLGKFYEHHGRDLCGEYVGQTAPKTMNICKQAYGSVLFIDEAYSLAAGGPSSNDYGKEAIDTLIAEMENHSDDLVVIFAGYPDDMDRLLDLNPGMRSRVPYVIKFPNYSREQLYEIFTRMAEGKFRMSEEFKAHAKEYFDSIPRATLDSKTFGNARYVRNLYERVWGKALARAGRENAALEAGDIELTIADFDAAKTEVPVEAEKNTRKIGFTA